LMVLLAFFMVARIVDFTLLKSMPVSLTSA
jgi:hypothetical protein